MNLLPVAGIQTKNDCVLYKNLALNNDGWSFNSRVVFSTIFCLLIEEFCYGYSGQYTVIKYLSHQKLFSIYWQVIYYSSFTLISIICWCFYFDMYYVVKKTLVPFQPFRKKVMLHCILLFFLFWYDLTFHTHCRTFYQAFLQAQDEQPAP